MQCQRWTCAIRHNVWQQLVNYHFNTRWIICHINRLTHGFHLRDIRCWRGGRFIDLITAINQHISSKLMLAYCFHNVCMWVFTPVGWRWKQNFLQALQSIRSHCVKWTILSFFLSGQGPSGRPSHLGIVVSADQESQLHENQRVFHNDRPVMW